MNVLSITRTEIMTFYKLYLALPDKNIELMMGEKEGILESDGGDFDLA